MPKVVDRDQRREQIADAVFDLVEARGMGQVSLRNVAEQAGLNIGSVRHYVGGYEGMLSAAVQVMAERVHRRIESAWRPVDGGPGDRADPAELAVDMMEQLLPLDRERRREVAAWLAFTEVSRTDAQFAAEARSLLAGSRDLAVALLDGAGVADPARSADLLAAAIDGLTIALLYDPGRFSRAQVRELLLVQLRFCVKLGLAGGAGSDFRSSSDGIER